MSKLSKDFAINYTYGKIMSKPKGTIIDLDKLYDYWIAFEGKIPNMLAYSKEYQDVYGCQPQFLYVNFGEFFRYFKTHNFRIE
jgi:hypothetical protein